VDTFTYNGLGLRVGKSDPTGVYLYVCDGTAPGSPVLALRVQCWHITPSEVPHAGPDSGKARCGPGKQTPAD